MELTTKLNEYENAFGDSFPTDPLLFTLTDEEVIKIIDSCIKQNKDVYKMGLLKDDNDIKY